jgi:hypothetical protein
MASFGNFLITLEGRVPRVPILFRAERVPHAKPQRRKEKCANLSRGFVWYFLNLCNLRNLWLPFPTGSRFNM